VTDAGQERKKMFDPEKMEAMVAAFHRQMSEVPASITDVKPTAEAWSLKEIVGHLVDSAANNHHRFVRLQQGNLDGFPAYDNEFWVAVQRYNDYRWKDLVALWHLYNILLLHVIRAMDEACLENRWAVEDESATLRFLVQDYFRHMADHEKQFRHRRLEVAK
jgi:hypothetical protein